VASFPDAAQRELWGEEPSTWLEGARAAVRAPDALRRRVGTTGVTLTVVVVAAIVGGVVAVAVAGSSKHAVGTDSVTSGLGTAGAAGVGIDQASTSSRGVTARSITVVFPVADLGALSSNIGFASDSEFGAQPAAIHTYVNEINAAGGIDGRTIDPIIAHYDPTNESDMRALCKQWTEGSPAVFAVVDGLGTWTGDNQLCVTQEGHTPFIGQWTTVTDWTRLGSPYLWWTGPNQSDILATVVHWAAGAGRVGADVKVGVLVGDRSSDQLALRQYLLPDLAAVGKAMANGYAIAATVGKTKLMKKGEKEVFISSTTREVQPVSCIEGHEYKPVPGPVTTILLSCE
jgi:hypothetical protein